jgi:hypothetical protein
MESPYFQLKEWSQEELDLMIAKAVKPLQERIDVLEREQAKLYDDLLARIENLGERQTKNWNDLVQMIKARTDNYY